MAKRLTIREQQAIAAKNKRSTPAAESTESTESTVSESIDCESENVRDKQVNVKFTSGDLSRLKKAASENHRPVANYIYHLTMDKITQDGY